MGGLVKVIVRKEDGQIISMNRWTSGLPCILHDPKIYFGDESALNMYLKAYSDALADYEKHKDDKKFEINMTSSCIFEGHDNLAPVDYGIVVLDFITKTLISCNGYSNNGSYINYRSDSQKSGFNFDVGNFEEEEFVNMLENNHIKELVDMSSKKRVSMKGINTLIDAEKCAEQLDMSMEFATYQLTEMLVVIDRNDFELNFYHETRPDKAKAKMNLIGFEFNETDELAWTAFAKRFEEELA
jgi:hypothetical protein